MRFSTNAGLAGIFLAVMLLSVVGCGKTQTELAPVSGVVNIGGKPAANILVRFMPDIMKNNSGPSSSAITNEQGEFTLVSDDKRPGAVEGDHVVIFVDMDEERPEQGEELTRPPRLDSVFTTAAGGKRVTVVAGQPVTLDLP